MHLLLTLRAGIFPSDTKTVVRMARNHCRWAPCGVLPLIAARVISSRHRSPRGDVGGFLLPGGQFMGKGGSEIDMVRPGSGRFGVGFGMGFGWWRARGAHKRWNLELTD